MDAWLIILITISSGIALFAAIFAIKNRSEKKKAQSFENRATSVQVIQSQPPYPQQQASNVPPPYNPGFIQQPQQNQAFYVQPPIPSTSNQGIFNHRDPQAYYHPNTSNIIQVNSARLAPTLAPTSGMLSNPAF